MTYATVDDVSSRLGRPITDPNEVAQVRSWLDSAIRYIQREFSRRGLDLDAQVALADPAEDDVVDVQAQAVVRRVTTFDPEGLTSWTKSIDDASVTKRREGKDLPTAGWFTNDDWDTLLPLSPPRSDAFSTRPGFTPDTCSAGPWIP